MKILFIFLDGVGLGADDPHINPLARLTLPTLERILDGKRLLAKDAPVESRLATLISIDPSVGVSGVPQSATGQAVLLTGLNIPAIIGDHYGPKPNQSIAEILKKDNLFSKVIRQDKKADFLNAYPPRYFESIDNGHRLFSAVPLAVTSAGLKLKTMQDLIAGRAISADFTAAGWRDHLGIPNVPVLSLEEAGKSLARLAAQLDFAFFEYWLSDYAGHHQDMDEAIQVFTQLDRVLGGLLQDWDPSAGLVLITSDHGNLEDLSTRRHTMNPVPLLAIGSAEIRQDFLANLRTMTDIAPAILHTIAG
jgi:2,3-bisphosphoglycerate-independent phosphoglycerate mutase